MSKLKEQLMNILECDSCHGYGAICYGWDDNYEFEYCECNPNRLILEDGVLIFPTEEEVN